LLVIGNDVTTLDTGDDELRELIKQIRDARLDPKILEPLIEEYERKFGPETERQVLEIIAKATRRAWSEIAKQQKNNGIDDILDVLWSSVKQAGGEYTVERTGNSAQIRCTNWQA
jgi:hypothetical protein